VVFTQQLIAATSEVHQRFPCSVSVANPFDQVFEISNRGASVLPDRLNLVLDGSGGAQWWWGWVFTGFVDLRQFEACDVEDRV